jgi:two-component system, LuxR family, response regulator FixJ
VNQKANPTGRVFIVDDDEAVRESLQALLEIMGHEVETYASGEAFLATHPPEARGCALVDLRMPGIDGLTLIQRVKARGLSLEVVVVTGHGDIALAVQAMKAGAADFVEKPYTNERILEVVRRALARPTAELRSEGEAARARERLAGLTQRERDVLEQLVIGRPNKIIAYELKISPRTVEIHRANLMRKMEAESLSHLIRLALAAGLAAGPT